MFDLNPSGGIRALKFFSTVHMDIRRVGIKVNGENVGPPCSR